MRKVVSILVSLLISASCLQVHGQQSTTTRQSILRYDSIHHPLSARRSMVVSQNELASKVGQQILAAGGNAMDAAVAVGFALAVTLPRAGNLGGSGFMLIYDAEAQQSSALDFRSIAPASASLKDFVDGDGSILWDDLTFGAKAAAVPGTVAGLETAWKLHGSLPWEQLLQPAIALARDGFIVSDDLAFALDASLHVLSKYPGSMAVYSKDGSDPFRPGDLIRQADLQWSLQQISDHGAAAFYRGAIADKIVDYMAQAGGYISAADLDGYKVQSREPISTHYRGYTVLTMPPASAGGVALLQMLNVLENFDIGKLPQGSANSLHLLAETMKRVNANRRQGIGDTDFVNVPIEGMLSEVLAKEIADLIELRRAASVTGIVPMDANPYESRDTTHYSIVDAEGNGVATTYTLGYSFGSGLVIPGTGILLDNQMRNFSHNEPGHANQMEPGKRMVSTMSPTLVFDQKKELLLVTGTPGGSRIHNVIFQLIVNLIDYGMNIAEATHTPRIYQGWRSPELGVEQGISNDTLSILRTMGHTVEQQQTMGSTQSIVRQNDMLYGSADPRRPGALVLGND